VQAAHNCGEHDISVMILDNNYTIDFDTMQQIDEDTGGVRHVHRRTSMVSAVTGEFCTLFSTSVVSSVMGEFCTLEIVW